jgi:hypothetical protein
MNTVQSKILVHGFRVQERAEIYSAELEALLQELRETQKALVHTERQSRRSDEF